MLAKESAVTLPAVVMLDVALRLPAGQKALHKLAESWRRFAVLASTGIAYLALRFYVLGGLGIPESGQYLNGTLTLVERWMTSGRVFLQYFRLLLAPTQIASDYDFNSVPVAGISDLDAWCGLAAVAAAIVLAW